MQVGFQIMIAWKVSCMLEIHPGQLNYLFHF